MMWEFFTSRTVRAAKPHRCSECGDAIAKGDEHEYCAGKVEGSFEDYRLCADCALITSESMHADFFDEGFPMGETRNELRDHHGIAGALAWAKEHRAKRLPLEAAKAALRAQKSVSTTVGLEIVNERMRQVEAKGYAPDQDNLYIQRELLDGARAYLLSADHDRDAGSFVWPWPMEHFKPGAPRRDLIKAAALIVAEIERLDRIAAAEKAAA
jgi:hypothetical protein